MRKAYQQISDIIKVFDNPEKAALNMTFHLSKLVEETGEMAQSINKLNGRKKKKGESKKDILANIGEEAVDAIQCLMAIAINAGVDYDTLKKTLFEKNDKFATNKIEEPSEN